MQKNLLVDIHEKIAEIDSQTVKEDKSDDLLGEGMRIVIPSNIDIYTRIEILSTLKKSGHTNTLAEASNLIDELYKGGETQNEKRNPIALDKLRTN